MKRGSAMPAWPVQYGAGADGAAGIAGLQPLAAQCALPCTGDFLLLALPLAARLKAKLQAKIC
jgi:hypothetical protein